MIVQPMYTNIHVHCICTCCDMWCLMNTICNMFKFNRQMNILLRSAYTDKGILPYNVMHGDLLEAICRTSGVYDY